MWSCSFQIFVSCFAEYTDDEAHIPKHSSVIVRRTPIGGVKPAGRTFIVYVYLKYKMIFWIMIEQYTCNLLKDTKRFTPDVVIA